MALSDWSERQLLGLTAAVAGGLIGVVGGVDGWLYAKRQGVVREIARKTAEAKKKAAEAAENEGIQERERVAADRHREMLRRLPEESSMAELMTELASHAKVARLRITKFDLAQEKARRRGCSAAGTKGNTPKKLLISAQGGYEAVIRFLYRIEQPDRMTRYVAVKGFEIEGYGDGLVPGSENLDISIELETFVAPKPVEKRVRKTVRE